MRGLRRGELTVVEIERQSILYQRQRIVELILKHIWRRHMPRFRRYLRRLFRSQRPEDDHSDTSIGHSDRTIQPARIDSTIAQHNLANSKVKEIAVGCWLDVPKLRWGQYRTKEAAIMQLTLETDHSSDFVVTEFSVDLAFSKPTSCINSLPDSGQHPVLSRSQSGDGVYLLGRPVPKQFVDERQNAWKFSGHRIATDGGPSSIARWRWLALKPASTIAGYGDLHCGVAVEHVADQEPIRIQYHIEGKARESGTKKYRKPYRFSTRNQALAPWLLDCPSVADTLSDDDLDDLDEDVSRKFTSGWSPRSSGGLSPGISRTRAGTETEVPGSPLGQLSRIVEQVRAPSRAYGSSNIGGRAIVFQGDVTFGSSASHGQQNG